MYYMVKFKLFDEVCLSGYHEVEFNGQNLSSGVYLYWIVVDSYGEVVDPARRTGEWQDVRKMVLLC